MAGKKKIGVLLVDDHPIVRHGLRELLDDEEDMRVCGEAENAAQALDRIEERRPDLMIVDISMEGKSGIDLIKDVRARGMDFPILVLSVHDDITYAERAVRAGAQGYILKQEAPGIIIRGIRKILAGNMFASERMAAKLLSKFSEPGEASDSCVACLSDREVEILDMIGRGKGPKEIAETLKISVNTVETHRSHIKTKLSLETSAELAGFAQEWLMGER